MSEYTSAAQLSSSRRGVAVYVEIEPYGHPMKVLPISFMFHK